jgi:hypothetical protein
MITKISYGHLRLREENLSFNNNYITYELEISVIYIYLINHVSDEPLIVTTAVPEMDGLIQATKSCSKLSSHWPNKKRLGDCLKDR